MKLFTKSKNAKKIRIGKFYIIVTAAVFLGAIVSLYSDVIAINEMKNERVEIQALIEEEEKIQANLNSQKLYFESDSYIEKIAREKLGLVKSNDVIYIDRNSK